MDCLSQEQIECYVTGSGSMDRLDAVEEHLDHCQSCRKRTESLRSATGGSDGQDDGQLFSHESDHLTESISEDSPVLRMHRNAALDADISIEGYDILERLPVGGQAVVYKAFQKATKRVVALKVLSQGPHVSQRAQFRFEREVDLAASLRHPNIVTIYDSGITHRQYYYAMEYVEGKSLDSYIESASLDSRQIMVLFEKVCSAVAYAHKRGVMHRDLKPDNIMVDGDGQPHILDFGLAKLIDDSEQTVADAPMVSIAGKIIGTLAYMSPEQASGQPDAVDIRTDVYSIGMMLYKVFTSEFPYEVHGPMVTVLRNIQEVEPARPSKNVKNLSSEIEAIILKSLSKEPVYRYQSATELQSDIDCWLNGMPISARADSSWYVLCKLMARNKSATAVVALIIVIILSFSYISFDLFLTAEKARRKAESLLKQTKAVVFSEDMIAKQWIFYEFMNAWRVGNFGIAQVAARHLPKGTREFAAMKFLVDSRRLAEKEPDFRQQIPDGHAWFAEFVIAEHHLKNGDKSKALKHYRLSLATAANLVDNRSNSCGWHVKEMKARLYELTVSESNDNIDKIKSDS